MPTSKIKKDARDGKGTVKSLEHKWDQAKEAAGDDDNWPLTMHIYKNMTHQASVPAEAGSFDGGHPFAPKKGKRGSGAKKKGQGVFSAAGALTRLRASVDDDIMALEGMDAPNYPMTATVDQAPVGGQSQYEKLESWLQRAQIPHQMSDLGQFAICKGTKAEVGKALVAAGWEQRSGGHFKHEDQELYVHEVGGRTLVTDLSSW